MNKTHNVFKASFEQVIFFMNNTYVHLATKTTLLDQDHIAHKIPFSSYYFLWSLIRDYSYRGNIGLMSERTKENCFRVSNKLYRYFVIISLLLFHAIILFLNYIQIKLSKLNQ